MSSFVNYFAPLVQDERTPIAREPVKNGTQNRRSIAHVARRRAIECQRIEDAQVEQCESLTRNIKSNLYLASRTDSFQKGSRLLQRGERTVPRRYVKSAVTFPPHVTSASAIEKGKWLEWRDTPERTDSSGSNGLVEPDLDLDKEESFIIGRLVSADVNRTRD
jgi:hypothetical protein